MFFESKWNRLYRGLNSADGGYFDIVIGNPPYKVVKKDEKIQYLNYETLKSGDLYAYFFEKSLANLLKPKGLLSFITASLFIKGVKFNNLRLFLQRNLELYHLDVQGDKVFENVQMPTAILIGRKSCDRIKSWSFNNFISNYELIQKIESNCKFISELCTIMRGFEIGRNRVNSMGEVEFITGSDISKWTIKKFSFISKEIESQFLKDEKYFTGERILIRETGSELTALFLENRLYCNRSLYSIKLIDKIISPKYLVALLNSKLLQFYYASKFRSETELFPKIRIAQVKLLPIRIVKNQTEYINLVDKILNLKKENPNADTSTFEEQIDKLVYNLYELTSEEIAIIENP